MSKPRFTPIGKTLNVETIDGRMNSFARLPYGLEVRASHPIAEDGYGTVTVDGIPISRGKFFQMDMILRMEVLYLPVGEVAREPGRKYAVEITGFRAANGRPFADCSFEIQVQERGRRDPAFEKNDEVALEAARQGMVLLKNENKVLPLKGDSVLNCFGRGLYMFRRATVGASAINPRWTPDYVEAIRDHSGFTLNEETAGLYRYLRDTIPTGEQLAAARDKSDTAVIFISRCSGEFLDNVPDKDGYYLTDEEDAMVKAVTGAFEKTVAVINCGYPMDLSWAEKYGVKSLVYESYPGMLGAYALMEILDGRTNPSGKLPDTWPMDYYDVPASQNFINFKAGDRLPGEKEYGVHLYYEEDVYVGYRYFDSFQKPVRYSLGHGLSYTEFEILPGGVTLEETGLTAKVQVKNTGAVPGREVVQMYVKAPEGAIEKPNRVLVDFAKTPELAPGESVELTLTAPKDFFSSFDEETGSFVLEAGKYTVFLGDSLANAEKAGKFTLEERETLRTVERVCRPVEDFPRLSIQHPEVDQRSVLTDVEKRIKIPAKRPAYEPQPLPRYAGPRITYPLLKANPELLDKFVAQMSDDELAAMNVCGGSNWYLPWQNGEAGKTRQIGRYKLPQMLVSDGNPGVNVKKRNIGLPCSSCIAATFNKEIAYRAGATVADESSRMGIYQNLGPNMNLHRNPLAGRNPESFSEDPVLAGIMAGHHAKGLEDHGVGSCYKHLFCNNSDTSRKASHSILSERAFRELYVRVFEVANSVQKPSAVMTSYNVLNGIYPAENADVIEKIVRGEWGVDGMVMTDWGSYDTVDPVEMVKAGNCWLTEGGGRYVRILQKAVKTGKLKRAVLEHNVRHIIKTMLKREAL